VRQSTGQVVEESHADDHLIEQSGDRINSPSINDSLRSETTPLLGKP